MRQFTQAVALLRQDWSGLVLFAYLQALDLLTTVAFLLSGVEEANPLVRYALTTAANPLTGLAIVKILALGLGVACSLSGRRSLLRKANYAYGLLIVWNLVSLILGLSLRGQ